MSTQDILFSPEEESWAPSKKQLVGAWMTHLVTASSAVWGLLAILAITNERWIEAFWWMAAAVAIDSFDGMLARRMQVKRVLPQFDGALLDNIVDYLNYVFVPAYFLFSANLLPERLAVVGAALILLASAYQFSQSDAKTDDHYFKGFPSYWNVLVFYFFMLGTSQWVNFALTLLFTVLVFVPIKYIYPSRTTLLPRLVLGWSMLWGVSILAMLWLYPDVPAWLMLFSLAYVVFYHALSLYAQFRPAQR
ncbi:MAG: CDP-alcohol phosphatidyltransferase family protein [Caldilineaceae bacterium]